MEKPDERVSHEKPIVGVVTARKYEHCRHHEIGIITEKGRYIPLTPQMLVEIMGESSGPRSRYKS